MVLQRFLTVPEEQRACALQRLRRRRFHTADAMLRCRVEAGMSGPRDLEKIHEEIREDHRQSPSGLRGYSEEGIPQSSEGRKNCTCSRAI